MFNILAISEMQVKTTETIHFVLVGMANVKTTKDSSESLGCGAQEQSSMVDGSANL